MNKLLLFANAVICILIFARLFTYRRGTAQHCRLGACLAYVLMVTCATVALRIAFGQYAAADWAETLINLTLCVGVYAARGNVKKLFKGECREAERKATTLYRHGR